MEYTINLQDLFGLRRPIYILPNQEQSTANPSYNATQSDTPTELQNKYNQPIRSIPLAIPPDQSIKSTLGTVVLSPVTLEGGNYKERLPNGQIRTVQFAELLLPPTTLLEVNLKKVIVKTPLVSGQGSFKESISFDDYDVRIRGVFVGDTLDDVSDFLRRLMEVWAIPKEIEVTCNYLNLLGINALVIENIAPQQLEGKPLMLPFEIQCISDNPLQINFLGS